VQKTVNLCIGFIIGLVFMNVPINFGIFNGYILQYIQHILTLIGAICVIIFGLTLLNYAFKDLVNKL
jgi:putative Mn2+ efflux pump MntP